MIIIISPRDLNKTEWRESRSVSKANAENGGGSESGGLSRRGGKSNREKRVPGTVAADVGEYLWVGKNPPNKVVGRDIRHLNNKKLFVS